MNHHHLPMQPFRSPFWATIRHIPPRARTRTSSCILPIQPRPFALAPARHAPPFSTSAVAHNTGVSDSKLLLEVIQKRAKAYDEALEQVLEMEDVEGQVSRAKVIRELEPLALAWKEYAGLEDAIKEAETLLDDADPALRSMAQEEIASLTTSLTSILTTTLPTLLLPSSPTSSLSCILEIKSGVGGDEASLFVESILRMYTRYSTERGWKVGILSKTAGGLGGWKDVTVEVEGEGAFGDLRFERGVHRVQRVPATESAGRVHTSTIAVVVLPVSAKGSDNVQDDLVDEKDVKTEVMRSRGAGGQHVNKTESAVRLTHIPTGISVSMQDSRSQHQNKAWAWQILRARLLDRRLIQQMEDRRATRRSQVKGMDRSDKVRTYNFPQDRVTDHRIGLSVTGIENILEGEGLEYVIGELKKNWQGMRMESLLESGEDLLD